MISHTTETDVTHRDVPIDAVDFNPKNPRSPIEVADVEMLAKSLKTDGLLQPIGVRPLAGGSRFMLIYGARRLLAAEQAGLSELPANVYRCDDATVARMLVDENLHRKKLNPIEKARALQLLNRPIDEGGAGLTLREIGGRYGGDRQGKSQTWACGWVRLLHLPQVWQQRIASREIGHSMAVLLIPLADRADVLKQFDLVWRMQAERCRKFVGFKHQLQCVVSDIDNTPAPAPLDSQYQRRQRRLDDKTAAHRAALAETSDDRAAEDPTAGDGEDAGEAAIETTVKATFEPTVAATAKPLPAGHYIIERIVNSIGLIDNPAHLDTIAAAVESRRRELQQA